jgi:23S rRNA (guanosine2251-2'-O)-methyltransferase
VVRRSFSQSGSGKDLASGVALARTGDTAPVVWYHAEAMHDDPVFQATALGAAYAEMGRLPVSILLDNVRSLYNVGAFFRTADAVRAERIYLAGITPTPADPRIAKTALGAEITMGWEKSADALATVRQLRERGWTLAAVETSLQAVDLFDWQPSFPVCVVFGHEVDGISNAVLDACDAHVRIPTLGLKQSINVATAGGVVLYELLRRFRLLRGGR